MATMANTTVNPRRDEAKRIVAALGLFDGVHLGHRSVLAKAVSLGRCHAVTFAVDTMPQKQGRQVQYIYDNEQKRRLLTACGAEAVFALPFGEICELDGLSFCEQILVEQLHVDAVVCGEDYRFGRDAACTHEDLRRFGQKLGFRVEIVPQVKNAQGQVISSSKIRFLLESGQIRAANQELGTAYTLLSNVLEGNRIGRTLGFPTANQELMPWQCIPRRGVYVSYASLNDIWVPAITNIGVRPTVSDGKAIPIAETHLLDWSGELEGRLLPVTLCHYLRPERKFDSVDELAVQVQRDIAARRKRLTDVEFADFEME